MKVALFISAGGSFARYAKHSPYLKGEDIIIVADRPETRINEDVDIFLLKKGNPSYWDSFAEFCASCDLIFLNFNHIVPAEICERFTGKIINQHPSLLPAFKGLHVFGAIRESGVLYSGSTFHFVTPGVDDGPIICQTNFAVTPDDLEDDISRKNYYGSRDAYVQVIRWFADDRVELRDGRVTIRGGKYDNGPVIPHLELGGEM